MKKRQNSYQCGAFDGVAIGVNAGAEESNDGTYPTQNLTIANCPTGITKRILDNGFFRHVQKRRRTTRDG